MTTSTFDALTAAHELKAAGFDAGQAEALAAQLRTVAGADRDELATKADLAALEGRIEGKLYRALWIQGGIIVTILTALRFFPA